MYIVPPPLYIHIYLDIDIDIDSIHVRVTLVLCISSKQGLMLLEEHDFARSGS